MGFSDTHSKDAPSALNLATGSIAAQWNVTFDDWFATVGSKLDDLPIATARLVPVKYSLLRRRPTCHEPLRRGLVARLPLLLSACTAFTIMRRIDTQPVQAANGANGRQHARRQMVIDFHIDPRFALELQCDRWIEHHKI